MEILTNWWFWIIIAAIVFVLALIGYLTESMKKDKKVETNDVSEDDVKSEPVLATTEEPQVESKTDDWMNMPEVSKPLEEVKVDTISEVPNVETNDVTFTNPVNVEPAASTTNSEEIKTIKPETLNENTFEQLDVNSETPNESADSTVELFQDEPVINETEKKEETNTDIWGM